MCVYVVVYVTKPLYLRTFWPAVLQPAVRTTPSLLCTSIQLNFDRFPALLGLQAQILAQGQVPTSYLYAGYLAFKLLLRTGNPYGVLPGRTVSHAQVILALISVKNSWRQEEIEMEAPAT
jgi:hypothetical protein